MVRAIAAREREREREREEESNKFVVTDRGKMNHKLSNT